MVENTNKLTIAKVISQDKKNNNTTKTKSTNNNFDQKVNDFNVKALLNKFNKDIEKWNKENPILKKELTFSLPGTDLQSNPRGIETPINNNSMNQKPSPQNISIINSNSQDTVIYTSNVNPSFETNSTVPSVESSGSSSGTVSSDDSFVSNNSNTNQTSDSSVKVNQIELETSTVT
jgi:hypothetical protein